MTNNPAKVEALAALGVKIERVVPVLVAGNPHSTPYLEAKRERMDHLLPRAVVRPAGQRITLSMAAEKAPC